jgi:3-oxoacyl-[acyl-carrier protein] reductase
MAFKHFKQIEANAIARTPIKRPGTPRDIADGVLYLASQRAGFVTGEVLHITGGRYFSS